MNLKIPEEVAIFGPGPSLDNVDYHTVPWFRLCLSFTHLIVLDPTAVISKDGHALKAQMTSRLLVFCPNPEKFGSAFYVDISEIKSTNGTLELAVLACHKMGARKIHFYGIDSYSGKGGYAECMKTINPGFQPVPGSMRSYEEILKNTLRIIKENKIEAVFHND